MGLSKIPLTDILTPDLNGGIVKSDPDFWASLLQKYPPDRCDICLVDDDPGNRVMAESLGIRTVPVDLRNSFPEGNVHL